MSIVRVKRSDQFIHYLSTIKVMLENNERFFLGKGDTIEIPVKAGDHTIYAYLDIDYSPVLKFHINDYEILDLEVGFNLKRYKSLVFMYYEFFDRYNYLYIKENK